MEGLRKTYRRGVVLDGVSFALRPGEAVALLGSNGAGKSTLLGCVTGDRLPDAGEVRLCGHDPFKDPDRGGGVYRLRPRAAVSVRRADRRRVPAVRRGGAADGRVRGPRRSARGCWTCWGFTGAEGTLCRELSQGMGRKTAIIAALLHRPRALLMDEALNGLDRTSAERLVAELDARRAEGAAVLISSHDLDFVGGWCGRGLLLGPGGRWRMLEGAEWDAWRRAPSLTFSE